MEITNKIFEPLLTKNDFKKKEFANYSKTPYDVIGEFRQLKDKLDINEIFKIIEKFDFIYPYYQLAGYYLEKIGFLKEELSRFFNNKTNLIFYTMKNKTNYDLDEYWGIKY